MSHTGTKDSGPRAYEDSEERAVIEYLKAFCVGPPNRTSLESINERFPGIAPRAIRQILSDHDGVSFVTYNSPSEGLFICDVADDAEEMTRKLRSQVATMLSRIKRREAYTSKLPRNQGVLF